MILYHILIMKSENIKKKKKMFFRKKKKTKKLEGNAYIQTSRNNTIITITDLKGNTLGWSSSGACGFKGARKETPIGAQRAAQSMVKLCSTKGIQKLHLFVRGMGFGREAAIRSFYNPQLKFLTISDVSSYAHNGCRPPKRRRL